MQGTTQSRLQDGLPSLFLTVQLHNITHNPLRWRGCSDGALSSILEVFHLGIMVNVCDTILKTQVNGLVRSELCEINIKQHGTT